MFWFWLINIAIVVIVLGGEFYLSVEDSDVSFFASVALSVLSIATTVIVGVSTGAGSSMNLSNLGMADMVLLSLITLAVVSLVAVVSSGLTRYWDKGGEYPLLDI